MLRPTTIVFFIAIVATSLMMGTSEARGEGAALRSLQLHSMGLVPGAPVTPRDGKNRPTDNAYDEKLGQAKFDEFAKKFSDNPIFQEAGDQRQLLERMTAKNGYGAVECVERMRGGQFHRYAGIAHFINDYLTREVGLGDGKSMSMKEFIGRNTGRTEWYNSATNHGLLIENASIPGRSPDYLKQLSTKGDEEDKEFFQKRHATANAKSIDTVSGRGPTQMGFTNPSSLEKGVSQRSVIYQNTNAYVSERPGYSPATSRTILVRDTGNGDFIFKIEDRVRAGNEPLAVTYCY